MPSNIVAIGLPGPFEVVLLLSLIIPIASAFAVYWILKNGREKNR